MDFQKATNVASTKSSPKIESKWARLCMPSALNIHKALSFIYKGLSWMPFVELQKVQHMSHEGTQMRTAQTRAGRKHSPGDGKQQNS